MNASHQGRVALVTGAGRGIGQAIAIRLARSGARLVLIDLEAPVETAALIGEDTLSIVADVASGEEWARIAEESGKRFSRCDIVNNAGIFPRATLDELDLDIWRRTFAVNLDAHFHSAKQFVPGMRENGWGRFVGIASDSVCMPLAGLSHYMASKMAVIGFMRGLANEVAPVGITANVVLPAITNTPGTAAVPDEFKRSVWERQPIRKFAEPDDIAGAVAFLASDEAAFMTGQSLILDGGLYKAC